MPRQPGYSAPIEPGYRAVSLTPEAAQALREMSFELSAALSARVTLSQTVVIARKMAFMHYSSVEAAADGVVPR